MIHHDLSSLAALGFLSCLLLVPGCARHPKSASLDAEAFKPRQNAADQSRSVVQRILQGIIVEGVGEVAKYLPRIAKVAATASEYHRVHGTWPRGRSDLEEFAKARGVQLDLSEFSELSIGAIGDGERARMRYVFHPHGVDGTLRGQMEFP